MSIIPLGFTYDPKRGLWVAPCGCVLTRCSRHFESVVEEEEMEHYQEVCREVADRPAPAGDGGEGRK